MGHWAELIFNALKYSDLTKKEFLKISFEEHSDKDYKWLRMVWKNPSIEQDRKIVGEGLGGIFETLSKLNKYSHSQGVIVRNKKIVAIEDKNGTEGMLKKCKKPKFYKGGVLVKFPKKKQDLRIDLPTIGFKTLSKCKSSGLKGIVLKNKRNVFLERKKCISFANKNKMFITVK